MFLLSDADVNFGMQITPKDDLYFFVELNWNYDFFFISCMKKSMSFVPIVGFALNLIDLEKTIHISNIIELNEQFCKINFSTKQNFLILS